MTKVKRKRKLDSKNLFKDQSKKIHKKEVKQNPIYYLRKSLRISNFYNQNMENTPINNSVNKIDE